MANKALVPYSKPAKIAIVGKPPVATTATDLEYMYFQILLHSIPFHYNYNFFFFLLFHFILKGYASTHFILNENPCDQSEVGFCIGLEII